MSSARRIVSIRRAARFSRDPRNGRENFLECARRPRITRSVRTYHHIAPVAAPRGGGGVEEREARVYKTFGITKSNTSVNIGRRQKNGVDGVKKPATIPLDAFFHSLFR